MVLPAGFGHWETLMCWSKSRGKQELRESWPLAEMGSVLSTGCTQSGPAPMAPAPTGVPAVVLEIDGKASCHCYSLLVLHIPAPLAPTLVKAPSLNPPTGTSWATLVSWQVPGWYSFTLSPASLVWSAGDSVISHTVLSQNGGYRPILAAFLIYSLPHSGQCNPFFGTYSMPETHFECDIYWSMLTQ